MPGTGLRIVPVAVEHRHRKSDGALPEEETRSVRFVP